MLYGQVASDRVIVEAVASIAAAHGVSRAQVALAWLLRNPVVSAPIVGATLAMRPSLPSWIESTPAKARTS
jgi:aryl-alcohol dehydrogenase (NADP+)